MSSGAGFALGFFGEFSFFVELISFDGFASLGGLLVSFDGFASCGFFYDDISL